VKNVLRSVRFYLWHVLHSYNSIWALLLTPSEQRTGGRDAERFLQRFPALADYAALAAPVRLRLRAIYQDYTATVSPNLIAISLELAVFLTVVCQATRPRAILDLGSGFSSFVFRTHASTDPGAVVHSVDGAAAWLDETRRFLERHHLDAARLSTWDDFVRVERPPFDLVLQDFADFPTRLAMLDQVLARCRPGGMLLIDDMHVPGYRRAVLRQLDQRGLAYYSLRRFTRQRLRYSYLVVP
jgi:predicted O-methyltransferase YrrM